LIDCAALNLLII